MKTLIKVTAIAAVLATSSASAFWGMNNGNGMGNGMGNGAGNGSGEGSFSFSMSAKSKVDGNVAGNGNGRGYGYNQQHNGYAPYYGAPAPYGYAPVAPQAPKAEAAKK